MHRLVRVRGERAQRGRDVRRLRVVDEARRPPTSPTGSSRCGTPGNVRSASAIASSPIPAARAAAVAAAAFSRLCAPRISGSAGSGSSAANSMPVEARARAARPAPARARRSAASRRGRPRTTPWRSRWSGSRLSSTATSQANSCDVLELERRQLADDPVGLADRRERHADVARRPSRRDPPRGRSRRAAPRVVVFPFVPVTPTKRVPAGQQPEAELDLRPHRDRRARAPRASERRSPAARPGVFTTSVDAVEQRDVVLVPERPVDAHDLVAPLREPRRRRRPGAAPTP